MLAVSTSEVNAMKKRADDISMCVKIPGYMWKAKNE